MFRKCNYHLKELYVSINALFRQINAFCELSYTLTTHTCKQLNPITSQTSLGEQIKYYRSREDIKQTDLGAILNSNRHTLHNIETNKIKYANINLIKNIINELDIKDKININDDYIAFLLDKPNEKILNARKKRKLTREQFANLLGVYSSSLRKWENGETQITRKKFDILKEYL